MGLVSLVGDEGTGKTAVLECLRKSLGPDIPCAFVRDSRISFGRLLDTIASDLNLDLRFATKSAPQVFLALTRLTTQQARNGRTVVLIVDEAHNLPANVFDEIIHTASLHHDNVKAIQTVFAGRPELQPRLGALNPDRVGQRAILSRALHPFTARETQEYIEFRLACAGMPKQTVFPRKALHEIYDRSQGLAPKIHAACDKLLLSAFAATSQVCTREIIKEAFTDPERDRTEVLEHFPLLVTAARIETSHLTSLSEPEPPPVLTALLRVAVDARLGSLRPRLLSSTEGPFHLASAPSAVALPRGRFSLAGGELAPNLSQQLPLSGSVKALLLSGHLGCVISSIPVTGLTPRFSMAASAQIPHYASQLEAGKLIPLKRYIRLVLALKGVDVAARPLLQDFSSALQPMYPTTSLNPPGVTLCSQVPLEAIAAAGLRDGLSAVPPNRANDSLRRTDRNFVDVEPLALYPAAHAAATGRRNSLAPIVGTPNTLLPLTFHLQSISPPSGTPIRGLLSVQPFPTSLRPLQPQSRLKPADPAKRYFLPFPTLSLLARPAWIPQITTRGFLRISPAAIFAGAQNRLASHPKRLLVFVIPILAALALYSAPPAMRAAANTSRQVWQRTQGMMLNRAAIALDEDFRSGLSDWTNRGGSPASWSSDASGFVLPGALALYRPSAGMVDYQMQFLGTIDKKGLSWVARAADFNNYYAIRLTVLKPGPLPLIGVTRYAVIHGVPQKRVTTPLFMSARADTLYRVLLDIKGDQFTLSVQDQPVDSWSESRLRHGSIGFFSEKDAESRIASLHVRGHYDMLGRLCAFLMSPSTIR